MPGPAPKNPADRVRRNAPRANTQLLASVCDQPVPPWPLPFPQPGTWVGLWSVPQANMWHLLGWTRIVARYCWLLERTETEPDVPATIFGEVRQLEDRLGLTPKALLQLQWEIAPTPAAKPEGSEPAQAPVKKERRKLMA